MTNARAPGRRSSDGLYRKGSTPYEPKHASVTQTRMIDRMPRQGEDRLPLPTFLVVLQFSNPNPLGKGTG